LEGKTTSDHSELHRLGGGVVGALAENEMTGFGGLIAN